MTTETETRKCNAPDCIDGKWKGKSRYPCFTCKGTGLFTQVASDEHQQMVDTIREHLPRFKTNNFATSLCKQMEKKGSLSPKQMPYFNDFYAQAQKAASRPAPAPYVPPAPKPLPADNEGWDAVVEMLNAANDNGLKTARIRLHGLTFKAHQDRHGNRNNIAVVSRYGNELKAVIDRDTGVLSPRVHADRVDFTSEEWNAFKSNPIITIAEVGKKEGNCCFCARDLTDHRSTAHGYGAICAKKFRLPWGKATAEVIEADIAERVNQVIIEFNDAGEFVVKDLETGDVIASFTSRRDAQAFADQFSIVEAVE